MENIDIVYSDNNLLVVNKQAGLVSTKEGRKDQDSLEKRLQKKYKWATEVFRAGIIHRLDKGTSGLILVAKNNETLVNIKNQFKNRQVYKEYLALVQGEVSFRGEIRAPLTKKNFGKFGRRKVGIGGKGAVTCFKLVDKYMYKDKVYSLVEIELKTGRTHQIRAHFEYLGWPLLGDGLYGGDTELINRPFLQAKRVAIEYPTGVSFEAETDLAVDLKAVLAKMELYG